MPTKSFKDPIHRAKAIAAAKGKPRPNRKSKAKLIEEAKKDLITKELVAAGFLKQVGAALPLINKALIASASKKSASSAQDRKTVYAAMGILSKEDTTINVAIGQVLSELSDM